MTTQNFSTWALVGAGFLLTSLVSRAQQPDAPMRVTTAQLNDGSRQVTKVDPSNHTAEIATFAGEQLKSKVVYQLNDEGLWIAGTVYSGKNEVILRATYKYDATGRLSEEKQFTKDNQFFRRLVYRYGPTGKVAGIDAFDANDVPVRPASAPTPIKVKRK